MRSERKEREREEARPRSRRSKTPSKDNKVCKILSIIYSVLAALFVVLIMVLNILPIIPFILVLLLLAGVSIFVVPVLYSDNGNAERKKKMKIVACILIVLLAMGSYCLASTIGFLNGISDYVEEGMEDREDKHINVEKDTFNILVNGIDVSGEIGDTVSRSDVNMVISVNPQTGDVIITSIPRDYYVELPSKGAKDKLTHAAIYGMDESIATVEKLLGVDINYYAKVNYSTIIGLVDAIGGITIDSPYAFETHGMADKYYFEEGTIHLDGSQALAYCRERKSFADGDLRRNENQQLILEAIINKLTKNPTTLLKYTAILDAVKGTVETDMSKSDMTDLVKVMLKDIRGLNITKQSIKGYPSFAHCYALGAQASVVMPNSESLNSAISEIKSLYGEE
ncbi:MAG: LCP family protein [Firmicutes bacterium]|nr:LCP family protein [Bacillota bacterium]